MTGMAVPVAETTTFCERGPIARVTGGISVVLPAEMKTEETVDGANPGALDFNVVPPSVWNVQVKRAVGGRVGMRNLARILANYDFCVRNWLPERISDLSAN